MNPPASIRPAIVYEPDGYRTDVTKLMGRQSAGEGFLRAAVAAAAGGPIHGYTPRKASADNFAETVKQIDANAQPRWVSPSKPEVLLQLRHLYLPGPNLGDYARQRLRFGSHAWSLTGVTHTVASHGAMDSIAQLPLAPVMPWDAFILTSEAARATVSAILEAQRDYLRWRLGAEPAWTLPQLPVIPLGVHTADFTPDAALRRQARAELQIADDEIVHLFVGRLSFHAKAHPHAMYTALQAVARATDRKLVLVQCGWFANDPIEKAFREGAQAACPDVRCLYTDGRHPAARAKSWACADVFVSLSDNIQETFGLTPLEAMAAGLPVVVTDWDGYKDTVRDGVDGFRVRTWAPAAGAGARLAWSHEAEIDNYDMYCGYACQMVSVDHGMLVERLSSLATDVALRRRMGDSGREHATKQFDWRVVYRLYESLWRELDRLRPAQSPGGPREAPSRLDPFSSFANYPTHAVEPRTVVRLVAGGESYESLLAMPYFAYAQRELPSVQAVGHITGLLRARQHTVEELAHASQATMADMLRAVSALAKMGLVKFSPPQ